MTRDPIFDTRRGDFPLVALRIGCAGVFMSDIGGLLLMAL